MASAAISQAFNHIYFTYEMKLFHQGFPKIIYTTATRRRVFCPKWHHGILPAGPHDLGLQGHAGAEGVLEVVSRAAEVGQVGQSRHGRAHGAPQKHMRSGCISGIV